MLCDIVEDGIRAAQESRGLGIVYKRQVVSSARLLSARADVQGTFGGGWRCDFPTGFPPAMCPSGVGHRRSIKI